MGGGSTRRPYAEINSEMPLGGSPREGLPNVRGPGQSHAVEQPYNCEGDPEPGEQPTLWDACGFNAQSPIILVVERCMENGLYHMMDCDLYASVAILLNHREKAK